MLIRHRGFEPTIDERAFVAPTAAVVGHVSVGPRTRVMYGAVIDAEGSRVEIDECVIVAENAVLRATAAGDQDHPVIVGDHAFIGPHATLLGCTIGRCVYIATGVTILQGAVLKAGASVAVGALVHAGTVIPEQFFVPPNMIAVGDPVRLVSPSEPDELAAAIRSVGFARRAFGVEAEWEDRVNRYFKAAEVRSGEFAAHSGDEIVYDEGAG
jgi:carbonic anhydrase/acetyltransferase-like protein (isoleucine patch superfamily)